MGVSRILTVFLTLLLLVSSASAWAGPGPKMWYYSWWSHHWKDQDFKPYMDDPKMPHNTQWDDDLWTPQDWISHGGNAERVMDGFYKAQIVTRQYADDDMPILEVGQGFMRLSGQDQRRVVKFVDHVFGVTGNNEAGMFLINHAYSEETIGVYTRTGLQLQ